MRRFSVSVFTLLAVVCLVLDAYGEADREKAEKAAAAKLVGTWNGTMVIDEESMEKMIREQIGANADAKELQEAVKAAVKQTTEAMKGAKFAVTFKKNGTTESVVTGMGREAQKDKGKWEVIKESEKAVKVKLTSEDDDAIEATLVFDGNDAFSMELPTLGGAKFTAVFKRAKKTASPKQKPQR